MAKGSPVGGELLFGDGTANAVSPLPGGAMPPTARLLQRQTAVSGAKSFASESATRHLVRMQWRRFGAAICGSGHGMSPLLSLREEGQS